MTWSLAVTAYSRLKTVAGRRRCVIDRLTTDQVLAACPSGPAKGARSVVLTKIIREVANWTEGLLSNEAAAIWVIDFLYSQLPVEEVGQFVTQLDKDTVKAISMSQVVTITSGRYLGFVKIKDVYDITEAQWVAEIPAEWFETRVFNVQSLLALGVSRIRKVS